MTLLPSHSTREKLCESDLEGLDRGSKSKTPFRSPYNLEIRRLLIWGYQIMPEQEIDQYETRVGLEVAGM